jgi:pyruvate/2-oxoglutarate dehydrogenase complex dihydrolipoamide dehydrogenase (E3) component
MTTFDYDLIVIGAGSGGISSAILGKNLGKKVALVEKKKIGGDCTWYGCVPSKALIKSAEIARHFNQMGKYGLSLDGAAQLDTRKVMAHVRTVREQVYEEETPQIFEKMGIDVLISGAKFLDNHRIQVGSKTIASKRFVIATGSSPLIPPIEGIKDVPYLTNETLFDLQELPASMVIIGGGPIGTEMASALNHLGVQITQLEMADGIMFREDKELATLLQDHLQKSGIRILSGTTARKVERRGDKIIVTAQNESSHQIETDTLLLSVGRRPNVDGLDLDKAGVAYSPKGIKVSNTLQTSAGNIYAVGDVVGAYQFSHIAEYHAGIAVPNALLPLPIKRKVNYENIVWATFTDPELARGGLTEEEAREKYGDNNIKVYRFNYERVDRAKTDRATIGMSKFIVDKKGKLLGIHILGERAGELLHQAQLAKSLGVPFHKIQSMIHVYPTYGDMVKRPSVAAYVDKLQNNFFIKTLRKLKK